MTAAQKTVPARFLLLLSITLGATFGFAQETPPTYDPVYGFDPLLYNGRIYTFYATPGTEGTQYLFDQFDSLGSITVRGASYSNLTINYDIYNQQLILKFRNSAGSSSFIEVSYAWLENVTLFGQRFEIRKDAASTKRLYHVVGNGPVKIMYYLSKELLIDNLKNSRNHYFSGLRKEMYVQVNSRLISYKNNRGFIKAFNPARQALLKSYIHRHHIKVQSANDVIITGLINYCNTLSGS